MKKCSKCKIDKPFDQFTKRGAKYVSSTPGGDRQSHCTKRNKNFAHNDQHECVFLFLQRVRGILCHHCNVALGHLKDDPKRIHNLLTYLEKSYVAP